MTQNTISAGSNGQAIPGTSNIIHVTSNAGFSATGQFGIFLTSNTTIAVINYTGKGTNTFTGCSISNGATGNMTTNDIVIQSSDDGYTVQIDGQKKRMPGNGVQGTPTSAYGEYNSFLPTQIGDITPVKYYKMVGFYVSGSVYESFVVTISPSPSSVTNPNTGHALINTFVASFWSV